MMKENADRLGTIGVIGIAGKLDISIDTTKVDGRMEKVTGVWEGRDIQ